MENLKNKESLDFGYLKGKSGNRFNRVESSSENSFFKIFDISGDTAKFEYFGDDKEAIAKRIFNANDGVMEVEGSMKDADTVINVEPGELKRDGNGWIVTKPAKIKLVNSTSKIENGRGNKNPESDYETQKAEIEIRRQEELISTGISIKQINEDMFEVYSTDYGKIGRNNKKYTTGLFDSGEEFNEALLKYKKRGEINDKYDTELAELDKKFNKSKKWQGVNEEPQEKNLGTSGWSEENEKLLDSKKRELEEMKEELARLLEAINNLPEEDEDNSTESSVQRVEGKETREEKIYFKTKNGELLTEQQETIKEGVSDAHFMISNINGNMADVYYIGGVINPDYFDNVASFMNNPADIITKKDIVTIEPGKARKNSKGEWEIFEKIKIKFIGSENNHGEKVKK